MIDEEKREYFQPQLLTFKQQVIVALLSDLSWMPKFENLQDGADYLGEELPTNEKELLQLSQKLVAIFVNEYADEIVKRAGA